MARCPEPPWRPSPSFVVVGALPLALCAVALAAATNHRVVATSGGVTATMTYVHNPKSQVAPYSHLRVSITRSGRGLVNAPVNDRYCGTYCYPEGLRVVDVEGGGDPDVLLDLYSGGAHCCNVTEVFRYSTALTTYTEIDHVWGDPGY